MGLPRILIINIYFLIVLLLVLDSAECRGGRGGRFGGRFRSSSRFRSTRSSRISRISSVPVRTKYSGYRLSSSSMKTAAIMAGTVYGARLWMRRSTYRHSHSMPEVCYNDVYEGNMTTKYYGRFVCPGYYDPDDYRYCCGSVGSQTCCDNAFDSSSAQGSGRIAGIVIGVIVAVIVVAVIAYCCFKKRKSFEGKTLSTRYSTKSEKTTHFNHQDESSKPLQPMGYMTTPPPPTTMAYGVQPGAPQPPQPPSYGDAMKESYPVNSDTGYKSDDSTKGPLPYGFNPDPTPGSGYPYGQQTPADNSPYPSAPYPQGGGPAPYPPGGATAPYPPGDATAPYPPVGGAAPYPSGGGPAPYPPGNSNYPN